jgi:hypothetical protein
MDDYFDDFDDGDFNDDDSFDDSSDEYFEAEDSSDEDLEMGDEANESESHDNFTVRDAFILGGAMGFAYEEGLEEAERWKLEKKMNDKTDEKDDG